MDVEDPRMRFRVWVNAELVDESWIDASNPDADQHVVNTRARHMALVAEANRAGHLWLAEVYDPAQPEERAYVRMGTDAAGMVDPRPAN